jgi:hypothetical protein
MKKTIQRSEDLYIQFTPEELSALNIKPGDKFSWDIADDSILLKKYCTLDIDISEWSREVLEMLIEQSIENDVSVNDVIVDILEKQIKEQESVLSKDG